MATPDHSTSRSSSYKRTFDDINAGEASSSIPGIASLGPDEDTARRDRHKRPRSDTTSSPTQTIYSHVSLDPLPHTMSLGAPHSPAASAVHSAAASASEVLAAPSPHPILPQSQSIPDSDESPDVEMSLEFSEDPLVVRSRHSPLLDSVISSPSDGPSTRTSTTPSDEALLSPTGLDSRAQDDILSVPPFVFIPTSNRNAESAPSSNSNRSTEDRFRLSMERFSTFDSHISVLRNSFVTRGEALSPTGMDHSQSNFTRQGLSSLEPSLDTSPSSLPRERQQSDALALRNFSGLNQVRSDQRRVFSRQFETLPNPARLFSPFPIPHVDSVDEPNREEPSDAFIPSNRGRLGLTERRRQLSPGGAPVRSQPSASWHISPIREDVQDRVPALEDTYGGAGDIQRDYLLARAREVARARTRTFADNLRPVAYPPTFGGYGDWSSREHPYSSSSTWRARQITGDGPRGNGDFSDTSSFQSTPLTRSRELDLMESGSLATSRHRRTTSETEEAEAAFLFNEMEDRFHAANQDSLSRSPAASRNSSAHPDILRRPSYNPHSSGISRSQPSVPTSDAVRRRLPRISLLDDSPREDHRDILNRLRMPGGLSDADYPSDERRLEGRSRWTDDNVEAEDTLRPVPSRRDQFWHAPSEPSSRRHHVHSSSSNGDSDSLLRPMRFSRDVAQVRDTPEHHLSMNIPDRRDSRWLHDYHASYTASMLPWLRATEAMQAGIRALTSRTTSPSRGRPSRSPPPLSPLPPFSPRQRSSRVAFADEDEVEALLSAGRAGAARTSSLPDDDLIPANSRLGRRDNSMPDPRWGSLVSEQEDDNMPWTLNRQIRPSTYGSSATPVSNPFEFGGPVPHTVSSAVADLMRTLESLDHPEDPVPSRLGSQRVSTSEEVSRRSDVVPSPETSTPQSEQTNPGGRINLDRYHEGPFRASLARSERLRREREEEMRQRVQARYELYHSRTPRQNSRPSTALPAAVDSPLETIESSSIRPALSRSSTHDDLTIDERLARLRSIRVLHTHRSAREEQRELHDSVTRQLRTPAARLADPDSSRLYDSDALPSLLPDASANGTRQQQLIDNFRASRSSANTTSSRTGWGELEDTSGQAPWRHSRASRHQLPSMEDWNHDRHPRTQGTRSRLLLARRRLERDPSSQPRSFGDYMRDEDLDTSYEGLLRLTSMIGEARPRGTPREVIDGLPNGTYNEWATATSEKRCPICLDDYDPSDPVLKIPLCSHWFHKPCLEQWLGGANTCPVCRGAIDSEAGPSASLTSRSSRLRRTGSAYGPRTRPADDSNVGTGPGPNSDTEQRIENLLDFDDEERVLLLRSLRFLTRRDRDS